DQEFRDLQRRRSPIEQNGIAVLHAGRRRPGNRLLLLELARRALLQGRQGRPIADVNGAAVGAFERSLLVPVIQVAPEVRFGNPDGLGEVVQADEALLAYQIQDSFPAFVNKHVQSTRAVMKEIYQRMTV